jgi:hypothetical protein
MKTVAYVVLLILVLLSLALNVVVLAGLLGARQAMVEGLDQALEALEGFEDESFETTFQAQAAVPVEASVPFRREWTVPFGLTVPIQHDISFQETLVVPINTPLFKLDIDVPVSATIPVSLTVPVEGEVPIVISETIFVNTEVVVDVTVPVAVPMSDTPLPDYLDELRTSLETVRQQLLDLPQSIAPLLKQR